ncbi:MAG: TIM barrel protein [Lachnospira sp.]|nr:TIM barrel protein [Lachnospira sp.]
MKNIKIGATDWGLPGSGLYATKIASLYQLDAISLKIGLHENDYPLTKKEMQKIYLEEQQKYGIEYCALALNDFDFIPMHAREGSRWYETVWGMLRRAVPTAKALGIPMLQVPGFAESEMKTEEDMEYTAKAFRFLCDEAGEQGLSVASENDMDKDHFVKLYEMVDRDNFYLYYDSQNYYLNHGYNQVQILEGLYPYMCNQLHVKDGKDGALSGALLGTGDTGFYDTMACLESCGYEGYILLENYYDQYPMNTMGDPYELLAKDIEILRRAVAGERKR